MTKYVESFPNNIVKPRCLELEWGRIPWMARTDLKVPSIFPICLSKKNLGASNSDGSNTMDGSNWFESPFNNKITGFTMPNSNKAI